MVVNYLYDRNLCYLLRVKGSVATSWERVMVRFDNQSVWAVKRQRVLASTIACEGMEVSGDAAHFCNVVGGGQRCQTTAQYGPALLPPTLGAIAVGEARLRALAVGPLNVDRSAPLTR